MDLIFAAWHPSKFEDVTPVMVPANFGGLGGHIPFNWTPHIVDSLSATNRDPHIPQWNRLFPIVWNEHVLTPAEISALQQAGLLQVATGPPAAYAQPGTASIAGA